MLIHRKADKAVSGGGVYYFNLNRPNSSPYLMRLLSALSNMLWHYCTRVWSCQASELNSKWLMEKEKATDGNRAGLTKRERKLLRENLRNP